MDIKRCDILVVGGGGAALRAAIAAKEYDKGVRVMIATKGELGRSGVTAVACSDRMAFHATLDHTEPKDKDAWRYHADDIYSIGGNVSDYDLAEILARNSKDAFEYLEKVGVPFVKKDGCADQFLTDGSVYPRACYTGPKTAVQIEQALVKRCQELDIDVLDQCMIAKLVLHKDCIVGALALDTREKNIDKAIFAISSKGIVLATGGAGMAYKNNVYPEGMCGDGYALAYDAGAELVNMEFIQIGVASVSTKLACSGSLMRAIPRIINDENEEILYKYFPEDATHEEIYNTLFEKGFSWPVSNEHRTNTIDVAVYKEKKAGHKVYLDYSKNPEGFKFDILSNKNKELYLKEMTNDLGSFRREEAPIYRLTEINQPSINWFAEHGIDLLKGDMVEVASCVQYFQGGIKIDKLSRSTLTGLWAVGEAAGGQHGANRPGGNALTDCQVFGKIAGEDASKYVMHKLITDIAESKESEKVLHDAVISCGQNLKQTRNGEISAKEFREKIQDIMDREACIVRTDKMRNALESIRKLKESKVYIDYHGPAYYIENINIIEVCEMILSAALLRDESRGPHLRFQHYEDNSPIARKDDTWGKYIVIHKSDDMILDIRPPNSRGEI